ncbi:glycogen synthase GlgA [Acidobacteriota bacterium]
MGRMPRRILFVSSEVAPFAKTGGLADVSSALPVALAQHGLDVRVFMPKYGSIDAVSAGFLASTRWVESNLWDKSAKITLFQSKIPGSSVPIYFVSYDPFFDRPDLYQEDGKDYPDNLERFALFCHVVLKRIRPDGWIPDIIHCNDWQTGLIPAIIAAYRSENRLFRELKTLFTLHNIGYQGLFPEDRLPLSGLQPWQFTIGGVEFYDSISLLKAGLVYSDWITAVSPTYAEEIQTPEYGKGLEGVLQHYSDKLSGVLNGVDYSIWDPSNDPVIAKNYSDTDLTGKAVCKQELQRECSLPIEPDVPILAVISRLDDQKGFDLLSAILEDLLKLGVQFVMLGTGDAAYERYLTKLAEKYTYQVAVNITFNDDLAHKIEAGADIFLMPSKYEPCGLNQMYSLRYGTIPVVRRTGGLNDTVSEFDRSTGEGNGFTFTEYAPHAFYRAAMNALSVYWGNKDLWRQIQQTGMRQDFSWDASAARYIELYNHLSL